jgi:hypothetical protein
MEIKKKGLEFTSIPPFFETNFLFIYLLLSTYLNMDLIYSNPPVAAPAIVANPAGTEGSPPESSRIQVAKYAAINVIIIFVAISYLFGFALKNIFDPLFSSMNQTRNAISDTITIMPIFTQPLTVTTSHIVVVFYSPSYELNGLTSLTY